MAIALGLIIAIILLKYKPTYKVTLAGEELGYVEDEAELKNRIQTEIIEMEGKNIDFVSLNEMPNYEFKLVSRKQETNEEEIMLALKEDAKIMYKYYAVNLNNEIVGLVDNIEEAEQAVNQIKEEHKDDTIQLDLSITENYTENMESVSLETVQVAQAQVEEKVAALIEEDEMSKMPKVNGILLAVTPVNGMVTSRFGAVSSIRSGAHTGTDIYSCFAGAIGSLKGPKHGGANLAVAKQMELVIDKVGLNATDEQLKQVIKDILDKKFNDQSGLIYGIGHAVYTLSDPRCQILSKQCKQLAIEKNRLKEYELYHRFEELAIAEIKARKGINVCANIDFYSGLVYDMLGLSKDLYTLMFVIGRSVGWVAHNIENKLYSGKIIRPAGKYVGEKKEYIKMENR